MMNNRETTRMRMFPRSTRRNGVINDIQANTLRTEKHFHLVTTVYHEALKQHRAIAVFRQLLRGECLVSSVLFLCFVLNVTVDVVSSMKILLAIVIVGFRISFIDETPENSYTNIKINARM